MDISERIKNIEEEVANSISDLECFLQLLETEVQRFKSNIQGLSRDWNQRSICYGYTSLGSFS
ncbi:hypothetical protein HanXRQr2_Chr05g0223591 [Helianthus annuus]|uniref:Uncharacterized protein n=1 Tax=Helianthus annuus TaxID=4232 RepID=A0A251URP7_HELAN|nr:hypothetical protein HanXRQr2_Chr05g0223591 [Helianthus annuus]